MTEEKKDYHFDTRDEFNRKPIAETLIKILNSEIDISPMIIDGNWGTGKTEFCHKTINLLDEKKVQVVYIDAFIADHCDSPLLVLLSTIINALSDETKKGKERKKKLLKQAVAVTKFGTGIFAKAIVAHLLKTNSEHIADGIEKVMQEAGGNAIDYAIEQVFKEQSESEKNINLLKDTLSEAVREKPMIIFIDELDRCKPDFAVKMIEIIKHTFDIKNLKFVLIMNKEQLRHAIEHIYGNSIDSQQYLDKFIKFTLKLPEKVIKSRQMRDQASIIHFKNLLKKAYFIDLTGLQNSEIVWEYILYLIKVNQLSLREIETLVRHIEIAHLLNIPVQAGMGVYNCVINFTSIFINCFKPTLVKNITTHQATVGEILALGGIQLDELEKVFSIEEYDDPHFYCPAYLTLIAADNPIDSSEKEKLHELIANYDEKKIHYNQPLKQVLPDYESFIHQPRKESSLDLIEQRLGLLNFGQGL